MTRSGTTRRAKGRTRIREARSILEQLGMPREQRNDRSALTLLALVGLTPRRKWTSIERPLIGITQMMDFFAKHYGVQYAPNTRETVRRQTVHQFVDAGLILCNPDRPDRPINSPKWCYQITDQVHELLRTFGTAGWKRALGAYLDEAGSLAEEYAQRRVMRRIPVKLPSGKTLRLSPGGQNVLVKRIIEQFLPRFTPRAELVYVGDAKAKRALFDERRLTELGIAVDAHGKFPDVVVYFSEKNWLLLIEAVTSHGPVNPKRHRELKTLFRKSRAGLVFVTAFLDRKALSSYLPEISWETEVWVADAPDHMIHFDGERFLGPFEAVKPE